MKIHSLLAAFLFILIAGFAFGANQAMAEIDSDNFGLQFIGVNTDDGIKLHSHVGESLPAQELIFKFAYCDPGDIFNLRGSIDWKFSSPDLRISFSKIAGSYGEAANETHIFFSIDTTGLQAGKYLSNIYFSFEHEDKSYTHGNYKIPVELVIDAQPNPDKNLLNFAAFNGQFSLSNQSLTITAPNNSAVAWNATTSASWLSLSQNSGTTPSTIQASINTENIAILDPGIHTAYITFTYPNTTYTVDNVTIKFMFQADNLKPGQSLTPGQSLVSRHGYNLRMQLDGNLVFSNSNKKVLWSSGTYGQGANLCIMQADGNLVIYNQGGQPLWSSGTAGKVGAFIKIKEQQNTVYWYRIDAKVDINRSATNLTPIWSTEQLFSGQTLQPGKSLRSVNGEIKLTMHSDGNLVLRNSSEETLWSTSTEGNPGSRLEMRPDGNLVIFNTNNQPVWSSNTASFIFVNNSGSNLKVLNDGSFIIYRPDGEVLWKSGRGKLY